MPIRAEDLRRIDLFAGLADAVVERVAAACEERLIEPGGALVTAGAVAREFILLIEGEVVVDDPLRREATARRHAGPTYMGAMVLMTDEPWTVGFSAATQCRVAALPAPEFHALMHAERSVERTIARAMVATSQRVEAAVRNQEKLAALGTLSAGLAHELNNPAAAARRTVESLTDALDAVLDALGVFVDSGVEREEAAELIALQREALRRAAAAPVLDILDASEREDEMAAALEAIGLDEWELAEPLAAAGLDEEWLGQVAAKAGAATRAAVRWVAASLTAHGLADELREATDRISALVAAVKEYSYMDQADVQDVDVHAGLESTLTMLGHKLRAGTVKLVRDYDRGLPQIRAYGSELNQVWTNLLDNAIDAIAGDGTLTVTTRPAPSGGVCVEIADTGPGIPAEIGDRIFEPFFTTKGVGEGSGLGLDTARRVVVDRHKGQLTVDGSAPGGGTRARVVLPERPD